MPRYFFDIQRIGYSTRDGEGSDLPDDRAAEREAIAVVQGMSRSLIISEDQSYLKASVRDEAGDVIFRTIFELRSERFAIR